MAKKFSEQIYGYLADDEDARVCKDIPEEACKETPAAFTLQLAALTLTRLSDTLSSAKLVLAWILSALGAPAIFISLLVPVREALSLLPQLFIAQMIRQLPKRKWVWVVGAVGQASALIGMVIAVTNLDGSAVGLSVIGLLAVLSLSRGICSVASKDVLGKTIAKTRRGRLTGLAASTSGLVALGAAYFIAFGPERQNLTTYAIMLGAAAVLWLIAALVFSRIPEVDGATEGGGNAITEAIKSLNLLRRDRDFRQFIIARALLIATAFTTPYLVILVQRNADSGMFYGLGVLIMADGLAALCSGYFWGKLSDSRSNHVMALAAGLTTLTLFITIISHTFLPSMFTSSVFGAVLLFLAAVAHQGTRIGRKTYLVDLATSENRAQYTAVGNTVIGIFLLFGSLIGLIDAAFGTTAVLYVLAAVSIAAIDKSLNLKNVTDE